MILVSLCFVAVLGIMLAGYLALTSRVMNLSNRGFQSDLSRQLAEAGIEEALRAFNKNDWSDWAGSGIDVNWTLDTTNKRATATISYPSGKFSQGVSAQVKVRVDNYDSTQLNSTWNSTTSYRTNDLVGRNGVWYRCVVANSNRTPTSTATNSTSTATFWIQEQMPLYTSWNYPTSYKVEAVVYYNGSWYRCILAHTSSATILPTNTAYWRLISVVTHDVATSVANNESLLNYWNGSTWAWWRYNSGWDSAPAVYWRWRGGLSYVVDDVVLYNGVWYRCISATSSATNPAANTTSWSSAPDTTMWTWSSASYLYHLNDVVFYSGSWYRCILAHTSSATILPTNSTYWTNAPRLSMVWSSDHSYSLNDLAYYNGVWYLCILAHTSSTSITPTNTSYWIGSDTSNSSYRWNSTTAYAAGSYRCYGNVWYRCIVTNTGQSPNNTTYWTASWSQSTGVSTGAPVVYAQAVVTLGDNTTSSTQLRAPLDTAPLFPNAVAANSSTITASSGGTVDSYDSNSGTYASQVGTSTNFRATIASAYTAGTAVTLSNTDVKGYIAAPPNSSSPYAPLFSSGGTVKGISSPPTPSIDLSRINRSPYIPQFDTRPGGAGGLATNWNATPKGTALALSYTTIIGTPGNSTPSRYFYNGNLTVGTATLNLLRINGPVILFINGNLNITASGSTGVIELSNNGSAEIHVTGVFRADAGGAGILSYNTNPKSLIIISDTTSATSHYYSEGVNPLYGVVYIPYSTSNSGFYNDNNSANIYGAVSANKVTYSGANMNIHYDTSLRYATFGGVDQPYTVTQWRELDAAEQATMP